MSTRACSQCGAPLPDNAKFCGQCGKVAEPSVAPAGPAIPTPVAPRPDEATLANAGADMSKTMMDAPPRVYEPDVHEEVTVARPIEDLNALLAALPSDPTASTAATARGGELAQTIADSDQVARAREMLDAALSAQGSAASPPAEGAAPAPAGPPPAASPGAPSQPTGRGDLGKTMALGQMGAVAAALAARPPAAAEAPPPAQAAPTAEPPAPPPAAPPPARARTMLGMPADFAPPPRDPAMPPAQAAPAAQEAPQPTPPVAAQPHHPPPPAPQPALQPSPMLSAPVEPPPAPQGARPVGAQKTMLGVALPGIAPTSSAPQPPPQAAPAPGGLASRVRTMLGVSVAGIQPGGAAPGGAQSRVRTMLGGVSADELGLTPTAPLPDVLPAPAPLVDEPLPAAPHRPEKRGVPAIAVVAVIGLVVLAAGGVGALLFFRGSAPLVASPRLDDAGKEALFIRCASCPDGTTLALGASSATIAHNEALLPLPAPLTIGDNKLSVSVTRPGRSADTVSLTVPVAYRARVDLTSLADRPPKITVRVEAQPGAEVSVDGKPVALDASGKAAYAIDVSAETEGESSELGTLDKRISFSITPKGGKPETQELRARTGILPLAVDAPGPELFTSEGSVGVAGRTKPGSKVTVAGQQATVDAAGRFSAKAAVEGTQTIDIVTSAPPLAPRHAHAKVVRVSDLEIAAKELEAKGPLGFDAFVNIDAAKGKLGAVEGEIAEIRVAGGQTIALVESTRGCAKRGSCLVRLVHGAEVRATRGDPVKAYGTVIGSVSAAGRTVPELSCPLFITRRK